MPESPRCRARPNGVSWAGLGWWLGWWLGWVGLSVAGLISIYNYKSVIAFRGSQLVVLLGFLRAGGVELGVWGLAGGRFIHGAVFAWLSPFSARLTPHSYCSNINHFSYAYTAEWRNGQRVGLMPQRAEDRNLAPLTLYWSVRRASKM